jgi:hypothetical protein
MMDQRQHIVGDIYTNKFNSIAVGTEDLLPKKEFADKANQYAN